MGSCGSTLCSIGAARDRFQRQSVQRVWLKETLNVCARRACECERLCTPEREIQLCILLLGEFLSTADHRTTAERLFCGHVDSSRTGPHPPRGRQLDISR